MKNDTSKHAALLPISDTAVESAIQLEYDRQQHKLELIASENYVSQDVLTAQGSILTNKYAEGYPGKRYYGGCEHVDSVETLAIQRLESLYNVPHAEPYVANVQPHSGSQANMAVYFSLLKPGDKILGMNLAHGGHLTHGSPVNFSGKLFQTCFYGVSKDTQLLDYNEIEAVALKERPHIIVAGASAYSRTIDFKAFRTIADKVCAKLVVDMAHIAGLVAAGEHPTPIGPAHYVTSTTHKTLRGPRGGIILTTADNIKAINSLIFPGIQGGPLMHVIAAKAVAFGEALKPQFKAYARQIIRNAQTLARALADKGYRIVSGGTDNHLMLVDLTTTAWTGKEAEAALGLAGITVNKNGVPFDTKSPFITSGIRLGTPALTTRGFKENDLKWVAEKIDLVLQNPSNEALWAQIKADVRAYSASFPLFTIE